MIEEKEAHLKQYYLLTKAMLDALIQDRYEDFYHLLEQREDCIAVINQLDLAAEGILMSEQIQLLLQSQMSLERDIQMKLHFSLKKLAKQVRSVKNEKFLTKQYEDLTPIAKGVFYDTKK